MTFHPSPALPRIADQFHRHNTGVDDRTAGVADSLPKIQALDS
jgi:hypothetical protein